MTAPDPRLAVADGLMGLIVGPEWRKMPSFAGRRDAILAALKAEAERDALKAALRYYASPEAWTSREVEGPDGDYGKRARAALSTAQGGE